LGCLFGGEGKREGEGEGGKGWGMGDRGMEDGLFHFVELAGPDLCFGGGVPTLESGDEGRR